MRRICALLLTAAFGLGVVGCGNEPAKPVTPPKPVVKETPKETPKDTPKETPKETPK